MVNDVNEGKSIQNLPVPFEKGVTKGHLKNLVELTDSFQELATQYLAFISHRALLRRQTQRAEQRLSSMTVHERK